MPVVQVCCPPLESMPDRLAAVCRTVADALGLRPDDVVATHLPAGAVASGSGALPAGWPVVVLHGSARDPAAQADAARRAQALVGGWFGDPEAAWATWVVR